MFIANPLPGYILAISCESANLSYGKLPIYGQFGFIVGQKSDATNRTLPKIVSKSVVYGFGAIMDSRMANNRLCGKIISKQHIDT